MASPVLGWDERVFAVLESSFGTSLIPAAAQGLEVVSLDMGPAEQGLTRPKKDKTLGRDLTLAFVEGRVEPIPFSLETSVKSRASATTAAKEAALLKAAGLVETVGGASVTYGLSSAPTLQGLSVYRAAGSSTAALFAEHGRGGVVKALVFSGGDQELMLKASGAFAGKYHLGGGPTGTLVDGSDTTLALTTAADAYKFALGWYQIESEVVQVTAIDYTTGILTVTRGAASTSAVAHSAAAIYPYVPTPTLSGSPISEANCTVTLDSIATRCTKFEVAVTTGADHLPLETGSKYVQGLKAVRCEVRPSLELVLTDELVALLGKATQRKSVALSIVCGTSAGGIVTLSMPTCELEAFPTPLPANDIVTVSPKLRVRGSSGNDSFSAVFS